MSTTPQLTVGAPHVATIPRHGKYACPLLRSDGTTETTVFAATPEDALANARMLANNPAYLAMIRPQAL